MEIKAHWADTQAIVWRMFSLSRMLLHLLPFFSLPPLLVLRSLKDVSLGTSSRWLSFASIKTEKNPTLKKKKTRVFFPNSWLTNSVIWRLKCQLKHERRKECAIDIFKCYRKIMFPTDSKLRRKKKKRGNRQRRVDPNCDMSIYQVIHKSYTQA